MIDELVILTHENPTPYTAAAGSRTIPSPMELNSLFIVVLFLLFYLKHSPREKPAKCAATLHLARFRLSQPPQATLGHADQRVGALRLRAIRWSKRVCGGLTSRSRYSRTMAALESGTG